MNNLIYYIKKAEENNVAIGHFNISNIEAFHAIYNSAKKLSLEIGKEIPIMIGVSEGEEEFIGRDEVSAIIHKMRKLDNYPIFLNADHHYSFETVKKAIDSGFDAVIIDAVKLTMDENIFLTKKCVDYAKNIGDKENRNILVEAELGFIGQSSKLLEIIPEGVSEETMTNPKNAKKFVKETGIDLLAPSVGNIHGLIKGGNPKLNIKRIKEIRDESGVPLVLHGGSGISNEDFTDAIKAGISIIHINTEIRVAYKNALEKSLRKNPKQIAPYKFLKDSVVAMENVIYKRLRLFNNIK